MIRQTSRPLGPSHPQDAAHTACTWRNGAELARAVAALIRQEILQDHAAVIIAIPEHVERLLTELHQQGIDERTLLDSGQLQCFDAAELVQRCRRDGSFSVQAYCDLVAELVEQKLNHWPGLIVYGETSDLLRRDGSVQISETLEQQFNILAADTSMTTVCGYRFDPFADDDYGMLLKVNGLHARLDDCADADAAEAAIAQALHDLLGGSFARGVDDLLNHYCESTTNASRFLAKLAVLDELLPTVAREVRPLAGQYYDQRTDTDTR